MPRKTKRGRSLDRKRRSSEPWERGRKAPKKGNPNYKRTRVKKKGGKKKTTHVYKLRKR